MKQSRNCAYVRTNQTYFYFLFSQNSNTSRHLSEFWMVEPEIAFASLEDSVSTLSIRNFRFTDAYDMVIAVAKCRGMFEICAEETFR